MQIRVNEQIVLIDGAITVEELVKQHKPEADLYIVDGSAVEKSFIVTRDDTTVVLIKKGVIPLEQELERMLVGRHSSSVHDAMKRGTVGIAGLGGLGSHAAVSLARMGIGRIIGVDFDIVEPSNISRQYYFFEQIGMKKCEALTNTIKSVNPFIKIDFRDIKITEDNVSGLFTECDIIIEALDRSNFKAMMFDAWQKYYHEKYYIGASGVGGYKDEPPLSIRKIGTKGFLVGDFMSEISEGLMATRVGIAAHMQANLAVKLLVEINA